MKEALYVGHSLITRIGDIGKHRAPIEAAGFIFPGSRIIELANRSHEPTSRFQFNPDDVLLAIESARLTLTDQDWAEAILWHTHPGGTVGPSSIDIQEKVGPIRHLVVALTEDGYIPVEY